MEALTALLPLPAPCASTEGAPGGGGGKEVGLTSTCAVSNVQSEPKGQATSGQRSSQLGSEEGMGGAAWGDKTGPLDASQHTHTQTRTHTRARTGTHTEKQAQVDTQEGVVKKDQTKTPCSLINASSNPDLSPHSTSYHCNALLKIRRTEQTITHTHNHTLVLRIVMSHSSHSR